MELSEAGLAVCAAEASPRDRYELLVLKSHCLSALGQWQEALGALELARQLGDELSIAKRLRNLGQAYAQLGNQALAQGFKSEAKLVNNCLAAGHRRAADVGASFK